MSAMATIKMRRAAAAAIMRVKQISGEEVM